MASKIPPQLRLAELEERRVQIRSQRRAAQMALPRAEWARNAGVLELTRQLRCLAACASVQRLRLNDVEKYRESKRKLYARNKRSILQSQKARYERDKEKILKASREYGRRKRKARNSDPAVLSERAARKVKRAAKMRSVMLKIWAARTDRVSIITPERKKMWRLKYESKPGYLERRRTYNQRPDVKERRRIKYKVREKELWRTDPQFAMRSMLRCRIRSALISHGAQKTARTEALIGCTIAFFKEHLESLFLPGMVWANRGEWHIDHKRPCASFDLTDPQQQRLCFHYTNMQPLWKLDNLRKGAKILPGV